MTVKFKLENKIKIPAKTSGRIKGSTKYPFANMKIGQSFLIKGKKTASISSTVKHWCLASGSKFKFTIRKLENDVRIWRIK
jgi:hypothetical protein